MCQTGAKLVSHACVSLLFPQQTLKLLAQRWGDPPQSRGSSQGALA